MFYIGSQGQYQRSKKPNDISFSTFSNGHTEYTVLEILNWLIINRYK